MPRGVEREGCEKLRAPSPGPRPKGSVLSQSRPLEFSRSTEKEPHLERARTILRAHPELKQLCGPTPVTAAFVLLLVGGQVGLAWALLLSPSPEHVARLPFGKIPDLDDFYDRSDAERMRAWRQVWSEGERLGDELREWMATGTLAEHIQPLR